MELVGEKQHTQHSYIQRTVQIVLRSVHVCVRSEFIIRMDMKEK